MQTSPLPDMLLRWYDANGRSDLPWRAHGGRAETAYHTWIAEIMLQQTTVAAVIPYYFGFLRRWPTVHDLAAAPLDDVLVAWAGLGYYARARNLHACAQIVSTQHDGIFPETVDGLKTLPGIGEYTANAIAAIAYDAPAVVVDGNIERVMSRVFCITEPVNQPAGKTRVRAVTASVWPGRRSGDFAQALMDLGAMVCSPKTPRCMLCPWRSACCAYQNDRTNDLPVKIKAKVNTARRGVMFVLSDADGRILLQQRPATGLLGGLWETPSTPWTEQGWAPPHDPFAFAPRVPGLVASDLAAPGLAPSGLAWQRVPGVVKHVFSHFPLELTVYTGRLGTRRAAKQAGAACGQFPAARTVWFAPDDLPALSTLMQKVLQHARFV